MSNKSYPPIVNGDEVAVVSFLVPTMNMQKVIIRLRYFVASSVGSKTFMLDGTRYKQNMVGEPVEGAFFGAYRIAVPKGESVEKYVELARASVKNAAKGILVESQAITSRAQDVLAEVDDFVVINEGMQQ